MSFIMETLPAMALPTEICPLLPTILMSMVLSFHAA
jgi:hypothetical protein